MRSRVRPFYSFILLLPFLLSASWLQFCAAIPSTGYVSGRSNNNPLNIDWDPAPSPEDGPPLSRGALRNPAYLPAQIGGIVGSYALSLVLVAVLLLALAKTRRDHLEAGELPLEENQTLITFNPFPEPFLLQSEEEYKHALAQEQGEQPYPYPYPAETPKSPHKNFSHPLQIPLQIPLQVPQSPTKSQRSGPLSPAKSQHSVYTIPSPTSTILAAGVDLSVDQTVVQHDRAMAQQQLEEMYKHVMDLEEAKAQGRDYEGPPLPSPSTKSFVPMTPMTPTTPGGSKRERNKPMSLNLQKDEKTKSRSSSILSFLKSPRRSKGGGGSESLQISAPIMTPMSGTFPARHHDEQEMGPISPRHYHPPPPPPVPSDVLPFRRMAAANQLPTPEMSPTDPQSIDGRLDAALTTRETREDKGSSHNRDISASTSGNDVEPVSAASEKSTSNLVGLPASPKPGVNRFPSLDSLPASPKPGQQSFRFNNQQPKPLPAAVSALRPGGSLPLRAYEPSLASPTAQVTKTTKETVFTRASPMSPGGMTTGMRTPWTGAPVPYSPYQPFSPVVPITPSLVTKADRKRMKRFEPKTPTVEMVKNDDEIW
ncbi:hypothetical protein QBC46DRAFT_370974 [Diplogelasinospora grovesii]|uniref:Uncharacterized protein n=1 Tax=Diplogelasinospora grovesii TaxID=303347 RepID=A0AAN6NGV5_9PEZI|nr:hypothetical protein QBC46DRAFT_370974 [Diplogelasinospora grovesii]